MNKPDTQQNSKSSALIIFTRNPELGKCKTRLAKSIGDQKALDVYKYLLNHTAEVCAKVDADKYVFYSEHILENDIWDDSIFNKKLQRGDDLGQKMGNAFSDLFQMGYKKVVIVGSDLLDLNSDLIEDALKYLDLQDIVIGPAEDGGYYLFGMKELIPEVFQNKEWGTDSVLNDTLLDLKKYDLHLLKKLNDIDTFEDLKSSPSFQNNHELKKIIEHYD